MTDTANAELRRKIMGFIVTRAIHAVTELGVVDGLANGPRSVTGLAEEVGANADALHRFLRALAGEGLFVEEPAGTFRLTPLSELLRGDTPGSLRHFSTLMSGEAYQVWEMASHSLRTGEGAFEVMFGKPMFEWLSGEPAKVAEFNTAQAGLVELRLLPLLDLDWTGVSTVVDIGGGSGLLMSRLLARYSWLKGTLFDLPHVVDQSARTLTDAGVVDRCRRIGGDFFVSVPPGADVYVLAQILHDWDDAQAAAILRRCREAVPDNGRLYILEQAIRAGNDPHPAKLLDLHMLVLLGGRERTEQQWHRLLEDAGFTVTGISEAARSALIEARPR